LAGIGDFVSHMKIVWEKKSCCDFHRFWGEKTKDLEMFVRMLETLPGDVESDLWWLLGTTEVTYGLKGSDL